MLGSPNGFRSEYLTLLRTPARFTLPARGFVCAVWANSSARTGQGGPISHCPHGQSVRRLDSGAFVFDTMGMATIIRFAAEVLAPSPETRRILLLALLAFAALC